MELKLVRTRISANNRDGSNRTFMELKFTNKKGKFVFKYVLIVPLWN